MDSNVDSVNRSATMADIEDVLVVTHPLSGGAEMATRAMLTILGELTTVSMVTANLPSASSIHDNHEVIQISEHGEGDTILTAGLRFVRNQFRMARVLASRDESVVLFYGATSYLVPIIVAKLAGKTVLLQPRGDVPLTLQLYWAQRVPDPLARALAGALRLLEWTGYTLADGIVTYTPSMAEELGLTRFEEKLYPHGARYIETERFSPAVPYEDRDQVVGFLGRIDEEKGIRTLAEVARRLPDDIRFRFVGGGGLEDWLREALSDEIAAGEVEVTGWVDHDDVPAELNRFRLLVMPSQPTEGLPTVIQEALACGTPVYASPVSGVPDVVRDGETGFIMDDLEVDAITRDIRTILARDDLPGISRNGRQLIEEEFSFSAAVDRYRMILTAVSSGD